MLAIPASTFNGSVPQILKNGSHFRLGSLVVIGDAADSFVLICHSDAESGYFCDFVRLSAVLVQFVQNWRWSNKEIAE